VTVSTPRSTRRRRLPRSRAIDLRPSVEQAPGDSWGYCITLLSENDDGTSSADGLLTSTTPNGGAGI